MMYKKQEGRAKVDTFNHEKYNFNLNDTISFLIATIWMGYYCNRSVTSPSTGSAPTCNASRSTSAKTSSDKSAAKARVRTTSKNISVPAVRKNVAQMFCFCVLAPNLILHPKSHRKIKNQIFKRVEVVFVIAVKMAIGKKREGDVRASCA